MLTTAWSLLTHGNLPAKPVRLIGVGISNWADQETSQGDLFQAPQKRALDRKIVETIDSVTEKFGKPILQVGMSRKK